MYLDPKLESAIRTALAARSADIKLESLNQPRLRPARRSTKPYFLAAASVILVVLIAVGGRWALAPSSIRSATPPPVAGPTYIGSTFRLTTVETAGKTWVVPAELGVTVEFTEAQQIRTTGDVAVQTGPISLTADGFVIRDRSGAWKEFSPGESAQKVAGRAFIALFYAPTVSPATFAPIVVKARLTADLLILKASGYTLSLVRIGPAGATVAASSAAPSAGSVRVSRPAPETPTVIKPAPTTRPGNSAKSRFELPDSSDGVALLIRTDFSNDAAWKAIVAEASKNRPMPGMPVNADNVFYNIGLHAVDDRRFEGMTMQQLLAVAPNPEVPTDEEMARPTGDPDTTPLHVYIADTTTMTNPEHPILAVNYFLDRGQHFRLIPKAMAAVEINLSIGNLDFNEYIAAAGPDGILRGY